MERNKFYGAIRAMGYMPPPFTSPNMNFFPHLCLSAAWAVNSVVEFWEQVYHALGVPSRFKDCRSRLVP